jgi:UDP-glucose 4-epimerase
VRLALSGEPITVFGDGSQERDCLYVDDVIECLLLSARSTEAPGEVFNVGNDERLSLRAIAEAIVAAADSGSIDLVPWPHDRDAIDIGSYYGDSSKAKRLLGWEPRTSFADGIARTVEFYRSHRSQYL